MNRALKFVRPVLSLDAAHLKSVFKGTLYVASVLTGSNDIFPIGFMISAGNEDGALWRKMLRYLKKACPIIGEQVYGNVDVDGVARPPFLFISDRDKGLKPALKAVFPDKFEMSCAKHIEGNVAQKFGKQCSKYVLAIAKTFLTRNSSRLFEEVRRIKPEAATYLDEITDNDRVLWRTTQWYSSSTAVVIPPRYGIVTSNTSEAVNNMFSEARDVGWLECVNKLIDIMSTRTYVCRKKYSERDGSEVVPRVAQIMKVLRWDAAASMTVVELESGCGDFKVVEPSSLAEDDLAENSYSAVSGKTSCTPVDMRVQSSGNGKKKTSPMSSAIWCIPTTVSSLYKTATFRNKNVFPVCLETLEYDGVTKEPALPKRQAGRPKTKQIRRGSKFVELKQSPITCSICGKRGHNRQSCVPSVQKGGAKSYELAPVSNSV
ncbi:MULE transposase domain [Fragilaria crotonensis]|nr:MULE transposase domain [Fragilaria crotonensis]